MANLATIKNNTIYVEAKQKIVVSLVNPNSSVQAGGYSTPQEVLDALNTLSGGDLEFSVKPLFVAGAEIGDPTDVLKGSYNLPDEGVVSVAGAGTKYGYFLFTDSNGDLGWAEFPLEFLTGFNEKAQVDGGTF